jgi:hypothetical protein
LKFEKIQPGMVLWDCHSHKMGNTTMSTLGTCSVHVIEVDLERRRALVKWNGNPEGWWGERSLSKLTKDKPILIRSGMGAEILAKRKEQSA